MSPVFSESRVKESGLEGYWSKYLVSSESNYGGIGRKRSASKKPWGLGEANRMAARIAKPRVVEAKMTRPLAPSPERIDAVSRLVKQATRRASFAPQVQTWKLHGGLRELQGRATVRKLNAVAGGTPVVTSLDKAVESLARLTTGEEQLADGELRMLSARLLRRAAVDQSRLAPRVSGIALLLSDSLLNSLALEANRERREALRLGLNLLMDSFVGEERERELYRSLMGAGWEVTAPFEHSEFGDLLAQAET